MKFLKNTKLMVGSALLVTGLTLLGIWCFRTPSREITRAELDQFVQAKTLTDGRVRPTPYAGIYHLEAKHELSGNSERVFVTTHLDEAQIKTLFDQSLAKVEIPDQSIGQWVMVLSNLLIVGVVIGVMVYQRNIGRGKMPASRSGRPSVSTTWPVSKKPKAKCPRWWISCATQRSMSAWVAGCPKAFC